MGQRMKEKKRNTLNNFSIKTRSTSRNYSWSAWSIGQYHIVVDKVTKQARDWM